MRDAKTEFELMKEDAMLYLALLFRQRGLEEDDDILDQIKSINNIDDFDIFNHLLSLKDQHIKDKQTNSSISFNTDTKKSTLLELGSITSFEGGLKEFRGFLTLHREFIGCELKESTDEYSSFVLYSYYLGKRSGKIKAKIYAKISEEDMWNLLQSNIKWCFTNKMEPYIYSAPFDVNKDKETGIWLSREREIITEYMIRNGGNINWENIKKEYNSLGVNKDINRRQIKISYTNTGNNTTKTSGPFNIITVSIPLITYGRSRKDMIIYISNHKAEFDNIALSCIERSKRFKRSGLSMNYFELDSLMLTASAELRYTFDIKKGIRKALEE